MMNIGHREVTSSIRNLLLKYFSKDMVVHYEPSNKASEEIYPKVSYFAEMTGTNKKKKNFNSFTELSNVRLDTPNYLTYVIQIDFWSKKFSEVCTLQETWIENIDLLRHPITVIGKDKTEYTFTMSCRENGRVLDTKKSNGETVYRRIYTYVFDVPVESPLKETLTKVKDITTKRIQIK